MQPYPQQPHQQPPWGQGPNPYQPPPPPKKQPGALAAIGAIALMCVVCGVLGRFAPKEQPPAQNQPTVAALPLAPAAPATPRQTAPAPQADPGEPPAAAPAAPAPQPAEPAPAADGRRFVAATCAQTARAFDASSDLSELQQNALWDADYEGRWVNWQVRVVEVGSTFGQLQLHFKCPRSRALSSDGIAQFDDEHRDALMRLRRGATVNLVARLTDHGQIMGLSLDDATLQ